MTKPHSRDLRKGRFSEPGRIYHVRTSTEQCRPLFDDFWLGWEVVKSLRFLHGRGDVDSLAYVVMPDHLHWLFRLSESVTLERLIGSMKIYTAHCINSRLGVQGAGVWQAGYFDRALRKDDDLKDVARYIVLNPIRAGLCRRLGDYALWDAIWVEQRTGSGVPGASVGAASGRDGVL